MKSEDELLQVIKEKYPRQGIRISQLFEENSDFRTLCLDYLACIQALRKYKKSFKDGERSIEEYETIVTDLEKELYDFIFPE
jgi:hypothetical protein